MEPKIGHWRAPSLVVVDDALIIQHVNESFEASEQFPPILPVLLLIGLSLQRFMRSDAMNVVGEELQTYVDSGEVSSDIIASPQRVIFRDLSDRKLHCNIVFGLIRHNAYGIDSDRRLSVAFRCPSQDSVLTDYPDRFPSSKKHKRLVVSICPATRNKDANDSAIVPPLQLRESQLALHRSSSLADSTSTSEEEEFGYQGSPVSDTQDSLAEIQRTRASTLELEDPQAPSSPRGRSVGRNSKPQRVDSVEENERLVDIISPEHLPNLRVLAQAVGVRIEDVCLRERSLSPRSPTAGSPPFPFGSLPALSSPLSSSLGARRSTRLSNQMDVSPGANMPPGVNPRRRASDDPYSFSTTGLVSPPFHRDYGSEAIVTKIELIASGYASQIYEVNVDGWICAMKEIDLTKMEKSAVRRCEQELEVMRTVPHHPNVCHYLGSRRRGNCIQVFLTKYSSNLWWKLRDMRHNDEFFTPIEVVRIALDVVRGLIVLVRLRNNTIVKVHYVNVTEHWTVVMTFQHDHGFVHRDLKSDNILLMLNERDEIKTCVVADFDACFCLSERSRGKTVIGTPGWLDVSLTLTNCQEITTCMTYTFLPGYIAPELLEAFAGCPPVTEVSGPVDQRDLLATTKDITQDEIVAHHRASPSLDVYGFGMILYELLERRRPYYDQASPAAVSRQILSRKVCKEMYSFILVFLHCLLLSSSVASVQY